jgi:hypothetical protein
MSTKIETPEALRDSGIYSIGTNDWVSTKTGQIIGTGLLIEPEEVWALKDISGSIRNSCATPITFELQLRAYSDLEIGGGKTKRVSTLLFTRFIKLKAQQAKNFDFKGKSKYLGKILGPYEESQELFLTVGSKVPVSVFASANFERMSPSSHWQESPNAVIMAQGSGSGPAANPNGDRYERDIYFIEDPLGEEYESEDMAPDGYHKMHNGKFHMCPKCTELVYHGDQSGGLEIMSGGEAKVEVKKAKDVEHDTLTEDAIVDPDLEVKSVVKFEGGTRATGKEMTELKVGAKNRPGSITCNACKAESHHEKNPPICKAHCPKMFMNDVIASSWHKGSNGKYHYCETCVALVLEANGIVEEESEK